ncbi:hypothetical protein CLV98_12324 [Dyadobacter jejuensis]|uniref:Uncharacterized protein n=1 Tax=Dyadobacter jejuensis TaxID=1082580 RepID=A0A316A8V2_9BACT|nr:hypothetical protein CLV98_12324 [Dyadobacter jejuensis]
MIYNKKSKRFSFELFLAKKLNRYQYKSYIIIAITITLIIYNLLYFYEH